MVPELVEGFVWGVIATSLSIAYLYFAVYFFREWRLGKRKI
jgi:hypothetical protein